MLLKNATSAVFGLFARPAVFIVLVMLLPWGATHLYRKVTYINAYGSPLQSKPFADQLRPVQAEIVRISRTRGWQDDPVLAQRYIELVQELKACPDPRYRHYYPDRCPDREPVTRAKIERMEW